jgi:DNA-binding response OmpR family regulator
MNATQRPLMPRLRALVIDNCPAVAALMARLLRCWGCEVRVAHDGGDAVALAEEFRPDVVLLEPWLSDVDGCAVARRLRSAADGPGLILSVSGLADDDDVRRARASGCDRHLTKPVDPDELYGLLAACPRRRGASPREEGASGARRGYGRGR